VTSSGEHLQERLSDMLSTPLADRTVSGAFRRQVETTPGAVFLVTPEREFTYRESAAEVGRLVDGLAARGVGAGSRVALVLPNSANHVWTLLALVQLGAVAVALNAEARGDLLTYFLSDSACELVMVDESCRSEVLLSAPESCTVIDVPATGAIFADGGVRSDPVPAPEFRDVFVVLYTSGSTGMPKAVPVTHAQAMTCGEAFAHHLRITDADRLYTCLPLFHINGLAYTLCGALARGASIALGPRFSAGRFWEDVRRLGGTQINAMGSMLRILELQTPHPGELAHGARSMFLTPIPSNAHELARRFGVEFATTYAQSEWVPSAMSHPGEGYDRPKGAAGRLLPLTEVRIVDDRDIEVPLGAIGEITLRAVEPHTTFPGYLGQAEASLLAFRNLWFHTGDLGSVDADGWLYFHGRIKDVIRRRGENISASVVEEGIATHPKVSEVAAVPVPSELGEDEVFVYVVPRAGEHVTPREIYAHALEKLPRFMAPRFAGVLDDFPRTAANKIAKADLRKRAERDVEKGLVELLHER
jgi:carnitine-CoA ligase